MSADKIVSDEQAKEFLRDLSLRVPEPTVRTVVDALSGQTTPPLYEFYAHGTDRRSSQRRNPILGKGTVDKIKKLYKAGKLGPYVAYLKGKGGESIRARAKGEQLSEATLRPNHDQTVGASRERSSELPSRENVASVAVRVPEALSQASVPSHVQAEGSTLWALRVETPAFYYQTPPLPPLMPGYRPSAWVVDVHLTNPSKTLPVGMRNIRLEVIREDTTHSFPHLGNGTRGSSGLVQSPEAALPVAVRIEPVTTLSGKLRFFEWNGFIEGKVKLDLILEESDGQVHRHTVSECFCIPAPAEGPRDDVQRSGLA